jgi:hypothetical protein
MKKIISISFVLFLFTTFSQSTFIRQNGISTPYYQIADVFSNAQSGDTIYLPGGTFSIGNLVIDKQLHIYGAGQHPDSTSATFATTLSGSISFVTANASNSLLTGVVIDGYVNIGTTALNSNVTNFTVQRCQIGSMNLSPVGTSLATNVLIDGNIILGNITGSNAQNIFIQNNLITGAITNFSGNLLVRNNTFLGGTGCPSYFVVTVTSGTFENNIFMNNASCGNNTIYVGVTSCTFNKNVFNATYSFPIGTNIGAGNYVSIPLTGFFINETDYSFSYTDNYHLTDPGLYLGNDATQCGMYGGPSPYKPGAVPTNPHIISKTIAPQTDNNGDLNINITVGAQDE